jgi:hypothetical protein
MKKSAWRLALAAVLFACWIGYLAYLAWTTTHPIVLSRGQFLSANLYVIAAVKANTQAADEPANEATIKQCIWAMQPGDCQRMIIQVKNLGSLKNSGWEGAGDYILALSHSGDGFVVTDLPRTPGFGGGPGRIYKVTPETQRQVERLKEEFHPSEPPK